MKNEIRSVLQFDGSYLNIRHIDLLVDWMTFQGHFVPFTRFGLSQMSDSVLKLASFERVMHFVVNGAIEQTYDDCRGCSERIILGQPVRVGTGAIDCFLDANKCKQAIVKKVTDVWSGPGEMGTPFKDVPEFNWETDTTWTATSEPLIPIFPVKPPPPSYPPPDTRMRFDPPFTSKEAANEEPYRPTSPTDEITAMDEEAYRPTSPTEEPTVMDEDPYRPTSPMDYTD